MLIALQSTERMHVKNYMKTTCCSTPTALQPLSTELFHKGFPPPAHVLLFRYPSEISQPLALLPCFSTIFHPLDGSCLSWSLTVEMRKAGHEILYNQLWPNKNHESDLQKSSWHWLKQYKILFKLGGSFFALLVFWAFRSYSGHVFKIISATMSAEVSRNDLF